MSGNKSNADIATKRFGGPHGVSVTIGLHRGGITVKGDRGSVRKAERDRCDAWCREVLNSWDFAVPSPVVLHRVLWG